MRNSCIPKNSANFIFGELRLSSKAGLSKAEKPSYDFIINVHDEYKYSYELMDEAVDARAENL